MHHPVCRRNLGMTCLLLSAGSAGFRGAPGPSGPVGVWGVTGATGATGIQVKTIQRRAVRSAGCPG